MDVEEAFGRLVLQPLIEHPTATIDVAEWDQNADRYVRKRILRRGQAAYDDRAKALWYCLKYMRMHASALQRVLNEANAWFAETLGSEQAACIVDCGCGPGTALLALRTELQTLTLAPPNWSYIGVDRSEPLIDVACALAAFPGMLAFPERTRFVPTLDGHNLAASPGGDRFSNLIVVFSYFFGQTSLDGDVAGPLTERVVELARMTGARKTSIVYTNVDSSGHEGAYTSFKAALSRASTVETVLSMSQFRYAYPRFVRDVSPCRERWIRDQSADGQVYGEVVRFAQS